ncbi:MULTISPECIES: restriction endonuclease subunit S [Chryseobacterium]|uniref:restriction endonuclease subunit S n=1 Tax=Chryseobacterium TaxID=59732 RepID=UPI00067D5D68|nr:restriction endonuclease subunit S [Chryseobacterium sp. Hurlbut01]KNB60603.1 hypothetical protein AC804_15595 [Chryseobacterium sp. Hurlbut01]
MKKQDTNMGNFPNLRFPGFEGDWEVKKLEDIAKFYSGGTPLTSKREYFDGDIPFIRSGEINSDKTEQFITEIGLKNSSAKLVEAGDILYALYGATSGEVGISKIDGAINQAILCIKSTENHYFIFSFLSHKKEVITRTYLQGGQGNLSAEIVKQIELSIPSINEQKKISNFLLLMDERIQTQKKIIEQLKTLMKAIREKVFSQKLRFKDDKGNYFPDWKLHKLGNLGMFFSGGTPLTSNRKYYQGNIPFIKSGEINSVKTEQFISEEALKNSSAKMVNVNDILYALYGATSGEVGMSKLNGAINQAILCIRTELDNLFLLNYLKLKKENILNTYLQGGQGNLSSEIIKSLSVPVPDLKEQTKIANFLSSIQEKIETEKQILENLELQKKFLLANLFV